MTGTSVLDLDAIRARRDAAVSDTRWARDAATEGLGLRAAKQLVMYYVPALLLEVERLRAALIQERVEHDQWAWDTGQAMGRYLRQLHEEREQQRAESTPDPSLRELAAETDAIANGPVRVPAVVQDGDEALVLPPLAQHVADSDQPPRPFADLGPSGLLWLINATVFHPRGFTLALAADRATGEQASGWHLLGDGREPCRYANDGLLTERFVAAQATLAAAAADPDLYRPDLDDDLDGDEALDDVNDPDGEDEDE